MKLSKRFTTVTPLSKYLAMALFITLPFLGFYLGMQYQKGITPYKTMTIIKYNNSTTPINLSTNNAFKNDFTDTASYVIPTKWKMKENTPNVITYTSPDYQESPRPEIIHGAMIRIIKPGEDFKGDLNKYILNIANNISPEKYTKENIYEYPIKNQTAAYIFNSWEESIVMNFITNNGYVWRIDLLCGEECGNLKQFKESQYYPTMQNFLLSINFNN